MGTTMDIPTITEYGIHNTEITDRVALAPNKTNATNVTNKPNAPR